MKKALFFGKIIKTQSGARVEIPNKESLAQMAWEILSDKAFGEMPIRMTIMEDDKGRDDSDMGYYWAVVIPMIQKELNSLGNNWSREETHEKLKSMFIKPDLKGMVSTKRMGKKEFSEYIENCCKFAAEFLSIAIPAKIGNTRLPNTST